MKNLTVSNIGFLVEGIFIATKSDRNRSRNKFFLWVQRKLERTSFRREDLWSKWEKCFNHVSGKPNEKRRIRTKISLCPSFVIIWSKKIGPERLFLLRHDKILALFRFFHRHLSYFVGFEHFLALLDMGGNSIEICRPKRAWSKRWPWLGFIDDKAVGGLVCRYVNTVTSKLKLAFGQ